MYIFLLKSEDNMSAESDFITSVRAALATYDASVSPLTGPTLVLIGDSRLNGDWNSILGRTDILNLSVAGTKASDWLASWQSNLNLIPVSVTKAIVQFGKNEIDASEAVSSIAHDIQDVVTIIRNHRSIKAGALGTLPVSTSTSGASTINTAVAALLPYISSQMSSASPASQYYEGYQTLVSSGALIGTYTDDGSHLNAAGKVIYGPSITTLEGMLT